MRTKYTLQALNLAQIPRTDEAVQWYHESGGNLTLFSPFGEDPLSVAESLVTERETRMWANIPDFSAIFHKLVNGDDMHFCNGLKLFIRLTERLATEIPPSLGQ